MAEKFPTALRRFGQRVIALLALAAGGAAAVGFSSNRSTALFHAAEQLGEHRSSAGPCLAAGGSGGITAVCSGGKIGGVLAQLASSSIGSQRIGAGTLGSLLGTVSGLLLRCESARCLDQRGVHNLLSGAGLDLRRFRIGLAMPTALHHPASTEAGGQSHRRGDGSDLGHARPGV
jgi:PPE-repeat protein